MKDKRYKSQNLSKFFFIVGFARSGTSWLGNIFNSHPDVIYRHEPFSKLSEKIGPELLLALKSNSSLSEQEKRRLLEILVSAFPESDRPPFFYKSHDQIPLPLRFPLWLAASKLRILDSFYIRLASPKVQPGSVLAIKEVDWSLHMQSLMKCLNPDFTLFLIRHPCAVVASILNGIRLNLMPRPDKKSKAEWFEVFSQKGYFPKFDIDKQKLQRMDDVEYFALLWYVSTKLYLDCYKSDQWKTRVVVYENLYRNPQVNINSIFSDIGLPFNEHTERFLKKSMSVTFTKLGITEKDSNTDYFSVYRGSGHNPNDWKKKLSNDEIKRIEQIVGENILNEFWG
jgi:hypothetical protein